MTTTTHRCTQTGETVELEARWDDDAQWYITRHEACSEIACMNYHDQL